MQALADMPIIPAMTTDAERDCYYRLVRENAHDGAVIELGAWLGASTAYIAAALRDAKAGKAHVYDKFQSKAAHAAKVRAFYAKRGLDEVPQGPCIEQFKANLGPLMDHVEVHQGQIEKIAWDDTRIAVLITDAPKRIPQISAVLMRLRKGLQRGSIMAWQDFGHFPSYEIPACLYRLRDHIEFVEAAVPGTTMVFRVTKPWRAEDVSPDALALERWTAMDAALAWYHWGRNVPPEKAGLFQCGHTLMLCDIGDPALAVSHLADLYDDHGDAILPKWRYLHRGRPDLVRRYQPLFDYLASKGAL